MPAPLEKFFHVFPNDSIELKDIYFSMKHLGQGNNWMLVQTLSSFDPKTLDSENACVIFWKKIPNFVRLDRKAYVSIVLTDDINLESGSPESIRRNINFWSMAEHVDMVISSARSIPNVYDRSVTRHWMPIHFYSPVTMGSPEKREKLYTILTVGEIGGRVSRQIHDAISTCFKKKHVHVEHSWDPSFKPLADQSTLVFPIPNYAPGNIATMDFGVVERCAATSAMLIVDSRVNDENANFGDVYKINVEAPSRIERHFDPEMFLHGLKSTYEMSGVRHYASNLQKKMGNQLNMIRAWGNAADEMRSNDPRKEETKLTPAIGVAAQMHDAQVQNWNSGPLGLLEPEYNNPQEMEETDNDDGGDGDDDDGGDNG